MQLCSFYFFFEYAATNHIRTEIPPEKSWQAQILFQTVLIYELCLPFIPSALQ
jgi:hypothetical protein